MASRDAVFAALRRFALFPAVLRRLGRGLAAIRRFLVLRRFYRFLSGFASRSQVSRYPPSSGLGSAEAHPSPTAARLSFSRRSPTVHRSPSLARFNRYPPATSLMHGRFRGLHVARWLMYGADMRISGVCTLEFQRPYSGYRVLSAIHKPPSVLMPPESAIHRRDAHSQAPKPTGWAKRMPGEERDSRLGVPPSAL